MIPDSYPLKMPADYSRPYRHLSSLHPHSNPSNTLTPTNITAPFTQKTLCAAAAIAADKKWSAAATNNTNAHHALPGTSAQDRYNRGQTVES